MKRFFITILSLAFIAVASSIYSVDSGAVTKIIGATATEDFSPTSPFDSAFSSTIPDVSNDFHSSSGSVIRIDGSVIGTDGTVIISPIEKTRCVDITLGISGTASTAPNACQVQMASNPNICPLGTYPVVANGTTLKIITNPNGGAVPTSVPSPLLCDIYCCRLE